jgi:hypothetical protein
MEQDPFRELPKKLEKSSFENLEKGPGSRDRNQIFDKTG